MPLQPLYHAAVNPAYRLRYSWSGWASEGEMPVLSAESLETVRHAWQADHLKMLSHRTDGNLIQILFSARPCHAPTFIAMRAKGRLDHALRQSNLPINFSRKLALRSIGENAAETVSDYINNQIRRARFADAGFASAIAPYTTRFDAVNPHKPIAVTRGRYWYCLHLVLVTVERHRFRRIVDFRRIYDGCLQIADYKGYRIAAISVMPDHLHLNLIGTVDHSPEQIVLAFQNNLAYAFGQTRIWEPTYYVGTAGAYDMGSTRR